jgi:DMSO reductase family type II enzyme chaperone
LTNDLQEILVRSAAYELLSASFLYPEAGRVELLRNGSNQLRNASLQLGWRELAEALQKLEDHLGFLDDEGLEREFLATFGHTISTDCPPYETEYDQAHVFQKSQTLADLGTFYQAFGVGPNPQIKERLDHISVELEFMNLLTLKEAYAHDQGHGEDKVELCRQAQRGFLANHLAPWIPSFINRLERRTGAVGIYAALGRILDRHISAEFARFTLDASPANMEDLAEPAEELDCAACPLGEEISQDAYVPTSLGAPQP